MTSLSPPMGPVKDPFVEMLNRNDDVALALIVGVEGPSYRPVGAAMAVFADGTRVGTLSSGCIESDIAQHALDALGSGRPTTIRYGRGSPFMDIQLPCGGGLDILIVPRPDRSALRRFVDRHAARQPCVLQVDLDEGSMEILDGGKTEWTETHFRARYLPDVRFLVFGKGPEASTFAALVNSAGYPNLLLSPDEETLRETEAFGVKTRHLVRQAMPEDLDVDPWTAIILFFHDHDWEPPILQTALDTPAFYIGSQGSQRARDARMLMLQAMGVEDAALERLHGPVGLIPSARDAGTLAVSVLAEILAEAAKARQ